MDVSLPFRFVSNRESAVDELLAVLEFESEHPLTEDEDAD